MNARVTWRQACLALALVLVMASPAAAQYFGQNKVQYKSFDFEVMKTTHFDIYFYPAEREAVKQAAVMAERWYARLSRVLNHELRGAQPLILYASHPEFEQTNAVQGEMGEGTGGVTEMLKRRIILPLGASMAESDHVIGHELVHAFQFDITSPGPGQSMAAGAMRLPLWFIEGMAEYLSIGPLDPHTAMWMRDAAVEEKIPTIKQLNDSRYFPYRWGQAFWSYVTGRWGDRVVGEMLRIGAVTGDPEMAIAKALGLSSDDLSKQWHESLRQLSAAVRQQTRPPSDFGRVLQKGEGEDRAMNISPALSPDGRRMMFLSQRDLLSIGLFLADAQTGKVIRKVVDTTFDPEFSSIQFIGSAGDWASDNRRFVFAAIKGGEPQLVIYDADADRVEKEIRFKDLGEIFNPSWSPDGKLVAFSALHGGYTDLFIHDLQAGTTKQVTSDGFADLHPSWGPDSRRLAFVTDRFTTRMEQLVPGDYRIALFDAADGSIRQVEGADAGKNINPQWGPDGSLYFVSDRSGISNVYRTTLSGGDVRQLTNLATGISGITDLSPAISFAADARRLAMSVYENGSYNLYTMDSNEALAGQPPVTLVNVNAALLPPATRVASQYAELRSNPAVGVPAASDPQVDDYKGGLSLDFIGQPYLAAGTDPYGTYAGGGISLFWSDMLGNHSLGTAVQVNSAFTNSVGDLFRNTGMQVAYQNLEHRWNWGISGGQMPYITGAYASGLGQVDGQIVGVEQQLIYRQVERGVSGVAAYPFNRVHRMEFTGGYTNITFDQQLRTTYFDPNTGEILSKNTEDLGSLGGLHLADLSAAFVYDSSVFGATSPIAGQSYRLQVTPTIGTIRMNTVLADYRRYFMPVSFYTLAARVMHYGRYGQDSEDDRLMPLYLGYPNLVRGYDYYSFDASECTADATSTCREFDRLLGSRMMVANAEFRFPLLRPFGAGSGMYGPIPLELAFFGDAGVAWNKGQKPDGFGGGREWVSSAGVALRANLFGYMIAQFNLVKPFQRPQKGWIFQFSLTPGW